MLFQGLFRHPGYQVRGHRQPQDTQIAEEAHSSVPRHKHTWLFTLHATVFLALHEYEENENKASFLRRRVRDRKHFRAQVKRFAEFAELVLKNSGHVSFKWPRHCSGWAIKELSSFIKWWSLFSVHVDGCAAGVKSK